MEAWIGGRDGGGQGRAATLWQGLLCISQLCQFSSWSAGSALLATEQAAVEEAEAAGYPVLLKATGGGGGIGIYTCADEAAVRANFAAAGRCTSG